MLPVILYSLSTHIYYAMHRVVKEICVKELAKISHVILHRLLFIF